VTDLDRAIQLLERARDILTRHPDGRQWVADYDEAFPVPASPPPEAWGIRVPSEEQVSDLIDVAAEYGLTDDHELVRPLLTTHSASVAEAIVFRALFAEIESLKRTDPYRTERREV